MGRTLSRTERNGRRKGKSKEEAQAQTNDEKVKARTNVLEIKLLYRINSPEGLTSII